MSLVSTFLMEFPVMEPKMLEFDAELWHIPL